MSSVRLEFTGGLERRALKCPQDGWPSGSIEYVKQKT